MSEKRVTTDRAATPRAFSNHQRVLPKWIQAHRRIHAGATIQVHGTLEPVTSLRVQELPVEERAVPAAQIH